VILGKTLFVNKISLFIFSLILIVILSGCESMPLSGGWKFSLPQINDEESPVVESNTENQQILTDQLNELITLAKPGEVATVAQSPWGRNHDIMFQKKYYSAGGRKCRELRLMHNRKDLPQNQYVCEESFGNWVPIRCISR